MAFDPVLEPGERIAVHFPYATLGGKENKQAGLVLTNRAVYWPGFKFGLLSCLTTKRMPLAEVVAVSIRDVWDLGWLLIGSIMVISGVIGNSLVVGGFVPARVVSFPHVALVVLLVSVFLSIFGTVIAVRVGRRRTLVIASEQTSFRWAEFHVLFGDGPSCSLFEQVCVWAQSNGLKLEVELEE